MSFLQTVVATAMLIRRFNFQIALGAPPVCVEMTTGATIHTTKGLKMTVTGRTRPPIIPTLETKVVTVDGDLQLSSTLSNAAAISSGAPKEDQQDEISTAAHQSQQVTG
ncbi:hypothetical protein BHM03_00033918 [Ensete ventricosum]|nr:hypothetical protein BHM03_00033918 [Ensete ventricosum]